MQTGVKQVFYFNASATSLGGYLDKPNGYVRTPCSAALSPTGGSVATRKRVWPWWSWGSSPKKILTCKSARTSVRGRQLETNGPWEQFVVTEVRKVNLLGRIKADRLVAQLHVIHPPAGGHRLISFAGSHFENLRVDDKEITVDINPRLLPSPREQTAAYNREASTQAQVAWPQLWPIAHQQAASLVRHENIPQWMHDRYSWIAKTNESSQENPAGYFLCSLVDNINGLASGPVPGHSFELPELGRIFLGEVMVYPQQASLSMLRAELGCPVKGQVSASSAVTNGSSCPPSFWDQPS